MNRITLLINHECGFINDLEMTMRPILPLVTALALLAMPQAVFAADNLRVQINVSVFALTLVWNTTDATGTPTGSTFALPAAAPAGTSEQRTWAINGVWYDGTTLARDGVTLAGLYNSNVHGRFTATGVVAGRVTANTGWTSLKNITGADVDLSVKATNANWTVYPTAAAVLLGIDRTMIEVSKDGGTAYPIVLTTTNQVLASFDVDAAVASDAIVPLDLRLTAPITGSNIASGNLLVTVTSFISP
jgi:hypothetical protein